MTIFCLFVGCNKPNSPTEPIKTAPLPSPTPVITSTPPVSPKLAPPSDARLIPVVEAREKQDYATALKLCRRAVEQKVPAPAILEQEAEIYKATAYLDKEIETLRKWARVDARDHHPLLKLFYIYLDLGWKAEAGEVSQQALALAPQDPRCHITRALLFYRSNEALYGLQSLETAERLDPKNREYANLHATILMKALRFAEAEKVLRNALTLEPNNRTNRIALAQTLLRQEKKPEAKTLLQEIQRSEPNSAEVAYELGILAEKEGDLTEAARQLETVISVEPQYSNTLFCLGRIYIRLGRKEQGTLCQTRFKKMDMNTSAFETALSRLPSHPKDPELHLQLAKFHREADELPQTIVELRRVLELSPNNSRALHDLETALTLHGRVTEARQLASPPAKP